MMGAKWYDIFLREQFVAELPLRAISSPAFCTSRSAILRSAASIQSSVGRSALRAGARRSRVGDRSGAQSRPGAFGTWRAVGALRCQRTGLSIPRDTFPHDRAERIAAAAQHQMLQSCGSTRRSAARLRLRFINHAFPLPVGDADATDGAMPRAS